MAIVVAVQGFVPHLRCWGLALRLPQRWRAGLTCAAPPALLRGDEGSSGDEVGADIGLTAMEFG